MTVEYASTFLMSFWTNANSAAIEDRDAADDGDQVEVLTGQVDLEPDVEHRVEAGHEEHAGDHHRRAVQQRADRRGAGHGVGQPGVQRELAGLADAGDEQRDRRPHQHVLAGELAAARHASLMPRMSSVPKMPEQHRRADQQADVADAHGEERLQRRRGLLASSSHQCPISMNEHRPMISQPRISCTMLGASAMVSMPAENSVRAAKKCV